MDCDGPSWQQYRAQVYRRFVDSGEGLLCILRSKSGVFVSINVRAVVVFLRKICSSNLEADTQDFSRRLLGHIEMEVLVLPRYKWRS